MGHDAQKPEGPSLLDAAAALDEALRRFETLAQTLERAALTSRLELERGSRILAEISEVDQRLGERVRALVEAVTTVRQRQAAQATQVQTRAREVRQRTEAYEELQRRYDRIGKAAGELHVLMEQLEDRPPPDSPADFGGEVVASLQDFHGPLEEVVGSAQDLHDVAKASGFEDLAKQTAQLQEALRAARNRLNALHRSLSRA